jgi:hypothetical protein
MIREESPSYKKPGAVLEEGEPLARGLEEVAGRWVLE